MENKKLIRDMLVVWISVTAFVCAVLNMHIRRNMLEAEDASVEESDNVEEIKK